MGRSRSAPHERAGGRMALIGSIPGIATASTATLAAFGLISCSGWADRAGRAAAVRTAAAVDRTVSKPQWKRCAGLPAPDPGVSQSRYRCATLTVPLDYAAPSAGTIGIALVKIPATGPGRRLGSLLFNFGGPGGDGVGTLARAAAEYTALNARYDLIGFDPRGVGRSSPVTCVNDRTMDQITAEDDTPDTAAEETAHLARRASYAKACQAASGRLLPHVGTLSAARDVDAIRAAVGDPKLNYFGVSYGTWLGGNYAHQFPGNVGRAVLDGAVDTRLTSADLALQQAAGFQRALVGFGAACARLGAKACPLGGDGESVAAATGKILAGLDRKPLKTSGGRRLTQSLGDTGAAAGLYSKQAWPYLAQGLVDAVKRHDGTLLLMLADLQNGRRGDGSYANLTAANTAITCADGTDRYTLADVRRLMPEFRKASPVFGPSMAWGLLQCTGWPVKGDDAAREVSAPSAAPILVVGNTGDPATPYAWASALVKSLGGRAALLTLKGEGHGAYDSGDACVRRVVDSYLLDGLLPADGATCD
ncbi:alpha/beta fold hydrolase [Actinomadura sp. LD22]|uniref:Alpha/beta fold hydrolase n=2 Tax=Actinomadura physcomitrii TaxID=2650748 RepID=A0A6I4MAW3_9ACTN|nr:alpha/beta fold hydrolase [Actinomadura physcomitrii]